MRAAVMRDRQLIVADVPAPEPGPGEVLVRTLACGICGSDLHALRHAEQFVETSRRAGGRPMDLTRDVVMGHEFCAEIVEHGPRTTRALRPGTRVCSRPVLIRDTGPQTIGYSNDHPGGYGELMRLSEALLLPVPDGLPTEAAALTEPMAVGLHAVNKSAVQPRETALVLGCGPIGIAVIAALRARGVESIAAADFSHKRRELAITMGAHQTIDPAQSSPFDSVHPVVVFDAVGVPGIIDDMMRRARHGTRLVVVGVCMQADTVHPFFGIAKEINVQFVLAYDPNEFGESLRAIAEGDIDVSPIITGDVGLEDVGAAFDDLADPERHCKILVTP
jgi:threonine dehydrogenase-like Zn-dependent dehydrogenase